MLLHIAKVIPQLAIIIAVVKAIFFKKLRLAAINIDAKYKATPRLINIKLLSKNYEKLKYR